MKVAFETLGCKANQFDTQSMEQMFLADGFTVVDFDSQADIYVINTCTVTAVSDKKSRQTIRQARRRNPDAVIGVCGCLAQVSPEQVKALGVDIIYGTVDRRGFVRALEACARERTAVCQIQKLNRSVGFEVLPAGSLEGRTRAYLKVEEGCDNYCTYCIIPYSRGHVRSLPPADACAAIQDLYDQGFRETVITGIEISSYGQDLADLDLTDLLEALAKQTPNMRIRLGSLEPRTITPDFCERISAYPNICPHFHLSLQSGCDDTLQRMRRKYDTWRYLQSVELVRRFFPNCGVTTDLITGFPGETEDEFLQTLSFIQKCAFSAMHIFPYSIRPGTPAAKMPQIPRQIKEERAHRAADIAVVMHKSFMEQQIGTRQLILFESEDSGLQAGHTGNYLPVRAETHDDLRGCLREVIITGMEPEYLIAQII